ncbi:MAG: ABC transporter permease [Cyclobacteriaceae bacterium]|nr:ABC transporter permease [Cyclobacteriaceae bacterium]
MRIIQFLVRKEFLQIFRNKGMLPIIFIMPVIQLVVLANAANFEIENLKLFFIDKDQSTLSRLLRSKMDGSNYFLLSGFGLSSQDGATALDRNQADLVIEIPSGFEKKLVRENTQKIQLVVNAIDGTKGALANFYALEVISQFNQEIRQDFQAINKVGVSPFNRLQVEYSHWFNPDLNYKTFMVPGILVLLVTMIGAFLSAMNIVREKEIGTIEQLNVTPIKKYQFITGKLLPFLILGLVELTIGFIIAKVVFDIPFVGSIFLIYGFAVIYLTLVLGLGLFISTFTETQQQAMFITWFFLVIFILMGGLFTAIENMPLWAQRITLFNPVRYFIEVVRMVMLKGSGLMDIKWHALIVFLYAVGVNGLAIYRYRKTV